MRIIITFLCVSLFFSCKNESIKKLEKGMYRASLTVQDNQELPFIFEVKNDDTIIIYNAEEEIIVDEITYRNDSIKIQTPVFEGYMIAKISNNELTGSFVKESYDRIVPFKAIKKNTRFTQVKDANHNISGNWETVFSENAETERYIAKGIFSQKGNNVIGTFRTTTGDYRYLEGIVDGDSLKLSTFDGAHAFLFVARITDSTMNGQFYSGLHWKEPFEAKLNNNYELPSADNLTFLKDGFDQLDFSFPDKNGKLFSLSDKRFQNKVTVVQIMGTWCPNCLDESKYLSKYSQKNKDIEVISLAFEVAKTKEIAFKRINRLQEKIGIHYPIVLAHFGSENKIEAHKQLPMLNHIFSFPTTIIIDKKGIVRKIHTGFNGPATGQNYLDFKKGFESFIDDLRNE